MEDSTKALVYEELHGAVKLEVYRFEGKSGPFLKAKLARIYTNEEGKWKNTSFFGERDLENLAHATAAANNYIVQNNPATSAQTY